MSTQNIKDLADLLDTVDEAHKAIEENTEARAKKILDEQNKADKQFELATRRAERAARARKQKHEDESANRDEEAAQLRFILGGGDNSQPEPEPQAPVEPEPDAEPDNPPTAVHQSVAPDPVDVAPAPAAPLAIDPRNWGWLAWLMAIAGLLVFLLVALVIGAPDAKQHAVQWVVNILWYVGLGGFGFFGGGLIGYLLEHRESNEDQD